MITLQYLQTYKPNVLFFEKNGNDFTVKTKDINMQLVEDKINTQKTKYTLTIYENNNLFFRVEDSELSYFHDLFMTAILSFSDTEFPNEKRIICDLYQLYRIAHKVPNKKIVSITTQGKLFGT